MTTTTTNWRIPLSRPDLNDDDRRAVERVLETSFLSLGEETMLFEEAFSQRFDGLPAAAVSSGSAGLYLALRALGVTGGEVVTPSYGFIATAHAIRLAGAEPRFADIDPGTLCVTAESMEQVCTPRTSALLPVHIFGTPAPMEGIMKVAEERELPVVEDSCEALGSLCQGRPAGTIGDAGVFAFYPNKQMTTGEGGLVVAKAHVIDTVASMRNQGRDKESFEFVREGFNFRLTELQAALGRSQLRRLDEFLARRSRVAAAYRQRLADVSGVRCLPKVCSGDHRSWFVFPVLVDKLGWRAPIRDALAERGIQTAAYFSAIHRTPPYADPALRPESLTVTEDVAGRSFALPFHNRLRESEIDEVGSALEASLQSL